MKKKFWRKSGRKALRFEFKDNAIVVTIPFNRLDLGNETQVTNQVMTQVTTQGEGKTESIEQKIIDFCKAPKSTKEIAEMLGYKMSNRDRLSGALPELRDKYWRIQSIGERRHGRTVL